MLGAVPVRVVRHVKAYFEENLAQYEPVTIMRASEWPDDEDLFMVIAKHYNGHWACWTCWNEKTRGLNHGHYMLSSYEAAELICSNRFNHRR